MDGGRCDLTETEGARLGEGIKSMDTSETGRGGENRAREGEGEREGEYAALPALYMICTGSGIRRAHFLASSERTTQCRVSMPRWHATRREEGEDKTGQARTGEDRSSPGSCRCGIGCPILRYMIACMACSLCLG